MTIYNQLVYSPKEAGINYRAFKRLYISAVFLGFLLLFCSPYADAQNTPPGLSQSTLNSAIQQLKQSLDRAIGNADRDNIMTLLQTAKEQHYQPGQVVALCELAVINDEQQANESAKNLTEAQQLASQTGEMTEVSWAIMEVGKIMRHIPSRSESLRNGLVAVISSLTHSMQHARVNTGKRAPTKTEVRSLYGIDTGSFPGARQAKAIVQMINKSMAGMPHKPDFNFTDDWLDTLVSKDKTSQKN